jgi:hypothetical protein
MVLIIAIILVPAVSAMDVYLSDIEVNEDGKIIVNRRVIEEGKTVFKKETYDYVVDEGSVYAVTKRTETYDPEKEEYTIVEEMDKLINPQIGFFTHRKINPDEFYEQLQKSFSDKIADDYELKDGALYLIPTAKTTEEFKERIVDEMDRKLLQEILEDSQQEGFDSFEYEIKNWRKDSPYKDMPFSAQLLFIGKDLEDREEILREIQDAVAGIQVPVTEVEEETEEPIPAEEIEYDTASDVLDYGFNPDEFEGMDDPIAIYDLMTQKAMAELREIVDGELYYRLIDPYQEKRILFLTTLESTDPTGGSAFEAAQLIILNGQYIENIEELKQNLENDAVPVKDDSREILLTLLKSKYGDLEYQTEKAKPGEVTLEKEVIEEANKKMEWRKRWQTFIAGLTRPLVGIEKSFWDKIHKETGYTKAVDKMFSDWVGWHPKDWEKWMCENKVNEDMPDDIRVGIDRQGNKMITMRLQASKEKTVDGRILYDVSWMIRPAREDLQYTVCFNRCEYCKIIGDYEDEFVERGDVSSGYFTNYLNESYNEVSLCIKEDKRSKKFTQPIVGEGFVPEEVALLYANQYENLEVNSSSN